MKIKNRGALSNPQGRFDIHAHESYDDGWQILDEEEALPKLETILYPERAKHIITRNDSPDLCFDQSINPYRGCEHGCIYCYARPSHSYVNLSPGLDFETKIFHKVDAAALLEKEINQPNYRCRPIVIGANTDPYQPAEAKLKVTRSLLEVLNQHNHPASIITKNALVTRDLDILSEMAEKSIISVAVSLTTLKMELKRTLEPRTSSPQARLRAMKQLSEQNVPVTVMAAPMIPMVNDMELEKILEKAALHGASGAGYVLLRLPHEVKDLFREWLNEHFQDRASHVMSLIKQMRGGKEYDAKFGQRMRGQGEFATLLSNRFHLACKRYQLNQGAKSGLDTTKFKTSKTSAQLNLWD